MIVTSDITSKLNPFSFLSNEKKQVLLFLITGGINTIFGYSIFSLFIFLKFNYLIAMLLSTAFGVIFSFLTMSRFVFKINKNILLIKFTMVYGILYAINIFIILELSAYIHNLYFNGAVSITLIAIASFLSNKYFVFRDNT